MGTKIFDKTMMTYQHGFGQSYTIPIYCWYLQGGDKNILVDTGEMHPIQSADREAAIGGKIYKKEMADIILPLHEPRFASMDTIPS